MKYSWCAAHPADTRPDTILKCFRKSIKPSPNNPRRDKTRQTGDYPRVIEGRNSDLPLSLDSASVFRFDLVCDEILWSSLSPIPKVSPDVKVSFCLSNFAEVLFFFNWFRNYISTIHKPIFDSSSSTKYLSKRSDKILLLK